MLNHTVLVADDHIYERDRLAKFLREAGARVLVVENCEDCMALIHQHQIDTFLLDINLPGRGGGIEICRYVRSLPDHNVTPILVLTERSEFHRLSAVFSAGSDDFLVKPVNPVILKARLNGAIAKLDYVRQLDRMQKGLARYVSPRTQEMIQASFMSGELPQPEEQELTVLFTDIRGFTEMTQQFHPEQLFSEVSRHLGSQVETVYRYGGYIDKFGGDGVMAIFDSSTGPRDACLCALEIIMQAEEEGTELNKDNILPLGIGIHYGPVIVGNIGWAEHLDYSAIGSTVNLAARLCGYAEPLHVVVSKTVQEMVNSDPKLSFSDSMSVNLRGVASPVTVYKLSEGQAKRARLAKQQ